VTPGGDPLVVMGDTSALRVRIDVNAVGVADATPAAIVLLMLR
jgi:hypothetical protein